jgi:hypothetical protein
MNVTVTVTGPWLGQLGRDRAGPPRGAAAPRARGPRRGWSGGRLEDATIFLRETVIPVRAD